PERRVRAAGPPTAVAATGGEPALPARSQAAGDLRAAARGHRAGGRGGDAGAVARRPRIAALPAAATTRRPARMTSLANPESRVELGGRRHRMPVARRSSGAGARALTFDETLCRLDSERRESTARVLRAQEAERLRIAQELHDQVGQDLTAVVLAVTRISSQAP